MLTLLTNVTIGLSPDEGKKDILIACDKICKIAPNGEIGANSLIEKFIDCDDLIAFPGLIDQHVHIIGGGGEDGFASRVPEIDVKDILSAGVTTVVGLLGADGYARSMVSLLAKAKALEQHGVTAYIYSGSYAVPPVTLTHSIVNDLILVDEVIGAGEIAISDHRSSQPSPEKLLELASQVHLGGMIGGKAGVVHLHVGDGKKGLYLLTQIVEQSDLPVEEFVPTHVNRNNRLFGQAVSYNKSGGNIDLTAGEENGISVPYAVSILIKECANLEKVTVSSDANGSIPGGGVGKIQTLYDDLKSCIINEKIKPEIVFRLASENVAKILKLYPKKGALNVGSDADILLIDKNYNVGKLISMGKLLIDSGKILDA